MIKELLFSVIACDPYLFKDTAPTEGLRPKPVCMYLVCSISLKQFQLMNRDKDVLNCDNYGKSYKMKLVLPCIYAAYIVTSLPSALSVNRSKSENAQN